MLSAKKVESVREGLTAVSFGVWQQGGSKKSWEQYSDGLGLGDEESRAISKHDHKEAIKTAVNIFEKLRLAGKKSGHKS